VKEVFQISISFIVGAAVSLERRTHQENYANSTFLLVCVGSTLLTILSRQQDLIEPTNKALKADTTRIAAAIVTGIGFLGGGFILRINNQVVGMTHATALWTSAALGIAIGYQLYILSTYVALIMIAVFTVEKFFERKQKREDESLLPNVVSDGVYVN